MTSLRALPLLASLALLAGCASSSSSTQPVATPSAPTRPVAASPLAGPGRPKPVPVAPAAPVSPVAPADAPAASTAATPEAPPMLKLTPEAEAVVYRFTHAIGGNAVHELADTTSFPSAIASLHTGAAAPKVESLGKVTLPPPKGLTADGNSTELVERDWTGLVLVPVNAALAKAYTSEVRLLKVEAHPLHDGRLRIWARVRNISNRPLPAEIACSFRMRGETTPNSPYFYQLEVPSGAYRDVFFVSPDGELSAYTVLVRSEEMWRQK